MNRRIKLDYRRVSNGQNHWHIDATIAAGVVTVERIYGDVTDPAGLQAAVCRMVKASPRYTRLVHA